MKIKRDGFFPYVTVPQVRYVKIPVPEVVRRVVQNRFTINGVSVPLATDCDGTLLSVAGRRGERTTMETSPVRGPVISLIRKGVDFAVISNSGAEDVAARFTDPLLSIFENHGEPQHMARVSVYTNGGALRWFFDDKGRVIQEGKAEYERQFEISDEHAAQIKEILAEAADDYWKRFQKSQREMRTRYPNFIFTEPKVDIQGKVKIAMYPLPDRERETALAFIERSLQSRQRDDLVSYQIKPGGSSTIDVFSARLTKASAIADIMREKKIPPGEQYPIIYFGDAFYVSTNNRGQTYLGEDMSVLRSENVVPVAVNGDQGQLANLPARIVRGGTGPGALMRWLAAIDSGLVSK